MTDMRAEIAKVLRQLERQRDELRLKLNLGKAEALDEREKLEKQLEQLRARLHGAREVAARSAADVSAAARLLAEEIRHGYERIRKPL